MWVCNSYDRKIVRPAKGHGVTGWEEFYIDDLMNNPTSHEHLWLCAGSAKYSELKVRWADLCQSLEVFLDKC
jgi:hypothetical protein